MAGCTFWFSGGSPPGDTWMLETQYLSHERGRPGKCVGVGASQAGQSEVRLVDAVEVHQAEPNCVSCSRKGCSQ